MVADLGLPKQFSKAEASSAQQAEKLNGLRAFLLCYYLNCGGAVLGYDRHENMRCIDSLKNAASTLARMSQRQQDKDGPAVVALLHAVPCVHGVRSTSNINTDTADRVPATSMLNDWETSYLHMKTSATLRSSFHLITAYTLLKSSGAKAPSPKDVQVCMYHLQELLVNMLNRKLEYLIQLGVVEWAHLITTLFLLARLGASEGVRRRILIRYVKNL